MTRPCASSGAAHEFGLIGLLLFLVVTAVRWLRAPDSPMAIGNPDLALPVLGVLVGLLLTFAHSVALRAAIRRTSESCRHRGPLASGGISRAGRGPVHHCPNGRITGRDSARRPCWGAAVRQAPIAYTAVGPAPTWNAAAVLAAEAGAIVAVTLMLGAFLSRPSFRPLLPYAVGLATTLIIALLGTRSGGSANPARQFGPALMSENTTYLWIYLLAPVIGAFAGTDIGRVAAALAHRGRDRRALRSASH